MNSISSLEIKRPLWHGAIALIAGFWLSAIFIVDLLLMPSLYLSGMMTTANFASAGYVLFWNFNRVELLSAALMMTGVLVLIRTEKENNRRIPLFAALILLSIALIDTYFFTPQMCAVGINLNLFAETVPVPSTMDIMHGGYWLLEIIKIFGCAMLLKLYWQRA
jgi:hypothetical protein